MFESGVRVVAVLSLALVEVRRAANMWVLSVRDQHQRPREGRGGAVAAGAFESGNGARVCVVAKSVSDQSGVGKAFGGVAPWDGDRGGGGRFEAEARARWPLVHEADFDEEGEAAFPFGGGAGDVVNLAAPGALQEAPEGAEEAGFAAG